MIRTGFRFILFPALTALWGIAVPAGVAHGLVYPLPGQHVADCADDDERHLTDDHSTGVREYGPPRMFQHSRYASRSDFFTYTFPVDQQSWEVWLAFEEEGECLVTVDGVTVLDEAGSGYGYLTPRQFRLTDAHLWEDGEIAVTFQDSEPEDGLGASILWIECGTSTRYRERIKHVEWDTTKIVWSLGLWDGTNHEFGGDRNDFRIGEVTEADIPGAGMLRIRWRQEIDPGKRYFLILGYLRGSGSIDVGDDGFRDMTSEIEGEEALDLEITEMLHPLDNVAALYAPGGIDFIALVETTPGVVGPDDVQVSFGGTDVAEAFSRVVDNSMFWMLGIHYDWTGFVDASPINGHWFQQYWPIDQATALRELIYWGYTNQAKATSRLISKVAWSGHGSNRSGGSDNTAGNMMVIDMVSLLERTDHDPALIEDLWPRIREHCDEADSQAGENPFGLIRGTNWENAGNHEVGPCLALSTNSGAYFAFLRAAGLAERLGDGERAERWRSRAGNLRSAMLEHLVYHEDTPFEGGPLIFPKGIWRYGILPSGEDIHIPLAGWLWGGSLGTGLYGLVDPDEELREIFTRTVEFGSEVRWMANRPRIAGYSLSIDGEDGMLLSAAVSDRVDLIGPFINAMVSPLDYREDVGAKVCELSRWALGTPGGTEDTNLVGTGFFLNCARFMAGVDDMLYAGRQVQVIPRLPLEWTECRVNGWPIRYRTADGAAWTELSYHLRRGSHFADMEIRTREPVEGLRIRLGPFPLDSDVTEVKTTAAQKEIEEETSGEAVWVWVTVNAGPEGKTVKVTVE